EGESDVWTCWHHGLPALGLPGSDTVRKTLHLGLVANVPKIYVLEEADQAGKDFVANVAARLRALGWQGKLLVVRLDPVKDANDLHKQDPAKFKERFQAALDNAAEVPIPATASGREGGRRGGRRSAATAMIDLTRQ